MIKLGYNVPEPLARGLRQLNKTVGVSLQGATAAGIFLVLTMSGTERDCLMRKMSLWLEADAPLTDSAEIPPKFRPELVASGGVVTDEAGSPAEAEGPAGPGPTARQKARAAGEALRQERERQKGRRRSG